MLLADISVWDKLAEHGPTGAAIIAIIAAFVKYVLSQDKRIRAAREKVLNLFTTKLREAQEKFLQTIQDEREVHRAETSKICADFAECHRLSMAVLEQNATVLATLSTQLEQLGIHARYPGTANLRDTGTDPKPGKPYVKILRQPHDSP